MNDLLKISDFAFIYMLIGLWFGDFFAMRNIGKTSKYVSQLLKKDAAGLQVALSGAPNLSPETRRLAIKKVRVIKRWYFLASKTGSMIILLAIEQWLLFTAKQNWGLVTIEISMLFLCAIILAADLRINVIRTKLEEILKPYEDKLWFEYRLRS
ncbi:hypothetical protein KOM07_00065 [Lentilactobacillus sp. G22-6]|uniref:hypothetical protein n=1 Tax=Lentilactobacillus dabitei TaxID=2831523 RepID=UPI001C264A60|nr:hypothetical protein [Lentilactobacillus dabitei]MBU9787957.1 hypothetical protein [Lentilactobacillus dabitei]